MPATLSEVRNQSMAVLNASTSYGTDDSDLFVQAEIDEAALEADLEVCQALIEAEHPHAAAITASTASGVSSGTALVDHLGPIFNVKRTRTDTSVVQAQLVPYRKLSRIKANDGSLYATANLRENIYGLDGNVVHFVGGGSLSYQYRTLTKGAALQAPADYTGLLVAGTLRTLFSKEALSEAMAQFYGRQFESGLARIWQKQLPVPMEVAA